MTRTETLAAAPLQDRAGSYIDVPAVLGGAIVAAAIGGLFTTFGAAIGFSTISARPGHGSFDAWMIVTAIWLVVTLVLSFLAGGYIAGRMRRRLDDAASAEEVAARDGINGLVVWGLGMVLTAWMAAGVVSGVASAAGSAAEAVGSAVGGTAQAVGATAGGMAQAAGAALSDQEGMLGYVTDTLMRRGPAAPAGAPPADTAELGRQSGVVLANLLRTGDLTDADRQFLIEATAQRTGLSAEEVAARVDAAVDKVQQTRADAMKAAADAKEEAIDAAETARISAILSAFLLTAAALVAAAAAVIGGVRGGHHRDEGLLFGGFTYRR